MLTIKDDIKGIKVLFIIVYWILISVLIYLSEDKGYIPYWVFITIITIAITVKFYKKSKK